MTAPVTGNPFVGLRPFETDEDALFFGREAQVLELLQRLHQHHFVAVIGSSGSGKSSLIKAGLIPALLAGYLVNDSDNWRIASMKPGQDPLYNLASAVAEQMNGTAGTSTIIDLLDKIKEEGVDALLSVLQPLAADKVNFFLLVDQFEELFRFSLEQKSVEKRDEAIAFVNLLLELTAQKELPVYVVITMRSDFIGDCTQFFGLPEALNKSQYLVPRLNRTQLKTTIEGPVTLFRGKINPMLTARLLNDLQLIKDELPLLQHALMRIWDHDRLTGKNGELDLEDYESIGGIEKALSNHADEALDGLTEMELLTVIKIFQALTTIDENGRKVRRPARLSELEALTGAGREQLLALINRFIEGNRNFLVINKPGAGQDWLIDISHESLIRQWGKLNGWVDEEAEAGKQYLRLVESATLYRGQKKDLMAGSELQLALQWYESFQPKQVWAQRYNADDERSFEYLRQSETEWLAAEKRKKKYKRNKMLLIPGLITIGLVILILAYINVKEQKLRTEAVKQKGLAEKSALIAGMLKAKADSNATIARQQSMLAEYNAFIALKLKAKADNSFIIARQQKKLAEGYASEAIAQKKIANQSALRSGELAKIAEALQQQAMAEKQKVTEVKEGYRLNELAREWKDKDPTIALRIEEAAIEKFPDAGFKQRAQEIFDQHAFYRIVAVHVNSADIESLAPQYKSLLGDAGFRSLFSKKIPQLQGLEGYGHIIASSTDGRKIASSTGGTNIVKLWDKNGRLIKDFTIPLQRPGGYSVTSLNFSPDGKRLFAGYTAYGSAGLWNTEGDGSPLWDMPTKSPYKHYGYGAFSPDGNFILLSALQGQSCLWDIMKDTVVGYFNNIGSFKTAAFSPDGKMICTSTGSGISLWDVNGNLVNQYTFDESAGSVSGIAFSAVSNAILTLHTDSVIRSWNIYGGLQKTLQLPLKGFEMRSMAFSPGAKSIFILSSDNVGRVWNEQGDLMHEVGVQKDDFRAISYSFGKNVMLTVSIDGMANLWDANGKLQKKFQLQTANALISAAAISPDGTTIVAGSTNGTVSFLNSDGEMLKLLRDSAGGHSITDVVFTTDGKKVLVTSYNSWSHGNRVEKDVYNLRGVNVNGSEPVEQNENSAESNRLLQKYYPSIDVLAVAFSADGTKVITGSKDGGIRTWEVPVTLEAFLRSDKIEPLSEKQIKEFGIK